MIVYQLNISCEIPFLPEISLWYCCSFV